MSMFESARKELRGLWGFSAEESGGYLCHHYNDKAAPPFLKSILQSGVVAQWLLKPWML